MVPGKCRIGGYKFSHFDVAQMGMEQGAVLGQIWIPSLWKADAGIEITDAQFFEADQS